MSTIAPGTQRILKAVSLTRMSGPDPFLPLARSSPVENQRGRFTPQCWSLGASVAAEGFVFALGWSLDRRGEPGQIPLGTAVIIDWRWVSESGSGTGRELVGAIDKGTHSTYNLRIRSTN